MVADVTTFKSRDAVVNLFDNISPWYAPAGAKASVVAKRASANCNTPVDVGAGKPRIDADFLNAKTKPLAQEEIVREVAMSVTAPIGLSSLIDRLRLR